MFQLPMDEPKRGFAKFKWLICVLALAALGAAAFWYWNGPKEKPLEYRTAPVARGDLTQVVTATGQLNPFVNIQVGSQISGRIQKLSVDFNSRVTNGQVIAQIDPATFQANVHEAAGQLARAKAALELAQVTARRNEQLLEDKLISLSDYDKSVADLHQAQADVQIREADVEKARVDLARSTIYSPIDGVVISRNVDVGQTVAASLNAPTLFIIANDLAKMQIDAMVSEADVGGVEEGQEVRFTVDAFPQRTFSGKVSQIRNSPTTVQNVVSYDTVVEVENKDLKLKPGMTANVSIVIAERENVLKLPNAALRFRPPETVLAMPNPRGSGSSNALFASADGSNTRSRSGSAREGSGREDRVRRFDRNGDGRLDEAEREAMRAEMRASGESGFGSLGGHLKSGRAEGQTVRTIYVLPKTTSEIKPAQIKTGISDGAFTEVQDGLSEGDEVVVGLNLPQPTTGQAPAPNPFGGGFRRRF
jgi:HlyD family secretion protein